MANIFTRSRRFLFRPPSGLNQPLSPADLSCTQDHADFNGAMTGQFFGPAAAEVGGVLQGTRTGDNSVVYGYFGGTKQ